MGMNDISLQQIIENHIKTLIFLITQITCTTKDVGYFFQTYITGKQMAENMKQIKIDMQFFD